VHVTVACAVSESDRHSFGRMLVCLACRILQASDGVL
jgi:hypothetical protein